MTHRFDVIVVGGGIIGVSMAYHLSCETPQRTVAMNYSSRRPWPDIPVNTPAESPIVRVPDDAVYIKPDAGRLRVNAVHQPQGSARWPLRDRGRPDRRVAADVSLRAPYDPDNTRIHC